MSGPGRRWRSPVRHTVGSRGQRWQTVAAYLSTKMTKIQRAILMTLMLATPLKPLARLRQTRRLKRPQRIREEGAVPPGYDWPTHGGYLGCLLSLMASCLIGGFLGTTLFAALGYSHAVPKVVAAVLTRRRLSGCYRGTRAPRLDTWQAVLPGVPTDQSREARTSLSHILRDLSAGERIGRRLRGAAKQLQRRRYAYRHPQRSPSLPDHGDSYRGCRQ